MSAKDYWRKRAAALEELTYAKSVEAARQIQAEYNAAIRGIDDELASWYARYAKEEGISLAEAKKRLSPEEIGKLKMDLKEYIRKARQLAFTPEFEAELRAASTAHHIDRLRELKIRVRYRIEVATGYEIKKATECVTDSYMERFFREAYELQKLRHGGQMIIESHVAKQCRKVFSKPWTADGRSFSERIWGNRRKLIGNLMVELSQGIMAGRPLDKVARALARKMETGFANAFRLVRTESAHFAEEATYESYQELGVERYQILATLDDRTSEICQEMDGQIFKLSEKVEGENFPPFHVNCRTTTVPADEIGPDETRLAKDSSGKWVSVPASMTYKEWRETMVKDD